MVNNKIELSVITAVYNRSDCIGRCIESTIAQTVQPLEHIIVDDGSNDNTLQAIKEYSKRSDKIKTIILSENRGVNFARNRAIEIAKGDFILLLDSDDWLTENAIEFIQSEINHNSSYHHYLFKVSDREKDNSLPTKSREFSYIDWLQGNITGDFCHVLNKNLLLKFPFFEEFRLYENLNWLRIFKESDKQLFIQNVVVNIERNRKDSLTKEGRLHSTIEFENEYNYLEMLIKMYEIDYIMHAKIQFSKIIKKYVIKAICLSRYKNVKKYITDVNPILRVFYKLKLGPLLRTFIIIRSYLLDINIYRDK